MISGRQDNSEWADRALIDEILEKVKSIAVVGLSNKSWRPSARVTAALIRAGYKVIGVNPALTEINGIKVYPDLKSIPHQFDLVDVFRRPDAIDPIIDAVIALKVPYLWLQEGVIDEYAAQRARNAGIKVIMDRCITKELYARSR